MYTINNPVNFTDPSGYFWKALFNIVKAVFNIASKVRTVANVVGVATQNPRLLNFAQNIPNFSNGNGGITAKGGIGNCISGVGCPIGGGGIANSLTDTGDQYSYWEDEVLVVVAGRLPQETILERFANRVTDIAHRVSNFVQRHSVWIDRAQTMLDYAGLVPGLGEAFDIANAGIYAVRGDSVNAGLSAAAAIPFVGWAGTAAKFGDNITGFTRHGLNQSIRRDGGRGVAASAILDSVRNPQKVVNQANGTRKFVGKQATTVLNVQGQVVTAFGKARGPAQQIYGKGNAARRRAQLLGLDFDI